MHQEKQKWEILVGGKSEYCEIVADTIYERINTTTDNLGDLGMQVKMINNDAYTENAAQVCSSMGINATYNEVYSYNMLRQM